MINPTLSSLGSLVSTALPCSRWILVENSSAGRFCGIADEVARTLRREGQDVVIRATSQETGRRAADIARTIALFRPSLQHPLSLIALGGDGTTNDALRGILQFLFARPQDLLSAPADAAFDRMLESGLQLGCVRMGGSSQVGQLYGAPRPDAEDVLHYLRESCVTPMNIGAAALDGGASVFFSHNMSAGTLNAPVYERTQGEHGLARRYHQKGLGIWNLLLHHEPFRVTWSKNGLSRTEETTALEVLAHATPRARNTNGLPTPEPGIGVKIIPDMGLQELYAFSREIKRRGRRVEAGDLSALSSTDPMTSLDPALQPALDVGEEIRFSFSSLGGEPVSVPVQINGDFHGRCEDLIVRALPPFPRFLMRLGSTMHLLRRSLAPS